ncbi:MAG: thiamine pyrophosphate-dependent dehydrogenase E1 component subunit alpha [Actinobacteria bacterium]|nr:thiamine pyrophosphate-dependent dehydrogenase E1 component subunit alpha [Actinomycetota bacterium]
MLTEPAPADLDLLLLIRHVERTVLRLFAEGLVSGTTHTCLGQEYVPVALQPLLRPDDWVFSNHRGHGHYLARFDDPHGLLAEITGRRGAVCHGVGGSQHLLRDRYLSTGVQGQSLPVAAGVALRLRDAEPGRLAVAYVGDGSWGEGAVYEALNIAALWQLPLLVVVEHNGIAQSTPTHRHLAGSIAARAAAFGIRHVPVDSVDLAAIRRQLRSDLDAVRERPAPLVVEFHTTRLGPHSKGDDTRDADHLARLHENDWLRQYAAAFPDLVRQADERQRDRVAAASEDVLRRPPVTGEDS